MFFRPSGGLTYHFRAALSRGRWRPFTREIETWLQTWQPSAEELLLFGPSGGYTLPQSWLGRFQKIHSYDTDPLAPWFFNRRHPRAKFSRRDLFWSHGKLSTEAFRAELAKHPSAAILFSNLLGQLPLEGKVDEVEFKVFLDQLSVALRGRKYASYHDLYSIEPVPASRHGEVFREYASGRPLSQSPTLRETGGVLVTDHLMNQMLWPDLRGKVLWPWSLRPDSLHLVEGVTGPA